MVCEFEVFIHPTPLPKQNEITGASNNVSFSFSIIMKCVTYILLVVVVHFVQDFEHSIKVYVAEKLQQQQQHHDDALQIH